MRPPLLVQQSGKVSGPLSPSGGEVLLFDSHCHLQKVSSMQATDRKVNAAKTAGVTSIAICATCPQDWDDVIFTSQYLSNNLMVVLNFGGELKGTRFPIILTLTTMLGWYCIAVISDFYLTNTVHPWFLTDNLLEKVRNGMEDEFVWESRLRSLLNAYPLAGVGECGLDKKRRSLVSLSDQVDATMRQLIIAADLHRPATLHCVGAYGTLVEAIGMFRREVPVASDDKRNPIILHRFAGDSSFIPRFCRLGCYISFSINELNKTNDKCLSRVKAVPDDRLLLESDSPNAEERSGPVDVVEACHLAAEIRGVNWRDLARLTTANAKSVFFPSSFVVSS